MQQVDFFIAGMQKSGTTALDTMLRGHPPIQMAAKKEVHFFDNEQVDWSAPDYRLLHDQFDWSRAAIRGEATPIYTYWPNALDRIAHYNPEARIVICLRHPAWRAHSHWRMEITRDNDSFSFQDAIRSGRDRVAGAPGGVHRVYSYVERGFYARQIQRALDLFGQELLFFLRTDHLWAMPCDVVARLCAFLGAPPIKIVDQSYIVPVNTSNMPGSDPADIAALTRIYADDIAETASLTGLDLSDWLHPAYREGIGRAAA